MTVEIKTYRPVDVQEKGSAALLLPTSSICRCGEIVTEMWGGCD